MKAIPTLRQLRSTKKMTQFSDLYYTSSSLAIPKEYMENKRNRVFGIYYQRELVGGFILARDTNFRTIRLFAQSENQERLNDELVDKSKFTEITCFFIARKHRRNTIINFSIWFAMTYALRLFGTKYFLFGTCSRSLAKLYSQTSRSVKIHEDVVKNKPTFIFKASRNTCVTGMLEIIKHKYTRSLRLRSATNLQLS